MSSQSYLLNPAERDAKYGKDTNFNVAQYLCDLHDASHVFNFCGSLPFQLQLSPKLREHLGQVAQQKGEAQPVVFPASMPRLGHIPNYEKSAAADNIRIFHGREVRNVAGGSMGHARGGQGCVLHLSLANSNDPEDWTKGENADYNGWGHDSRRPWRKAPELAAEGFDEYGKKFGRNAYGLHHRCYLHWDRRGVMWLSAEDGCEGEPMPMFN